MEAAASFITGSYSRRLIRYGVTGKGSASRNGGVTRDWCSLRCVCVQIRQASIDVPVKSKPVALLRLHVNAGRVRGWLDLDASADVARGRLAAITIVELNHRIVARV